MTITKQTKPYEFLARWNHETGAFKGAHIQHYETVLEDGVMLTGKPGRAMGVGEDLAFPLADIMSQLQADTLAANAALQATLAEHDATITAHEATIQTLTSERDTARARVAELEVQLSPAPVLLPVGEFISRFSGAEFDAVKALAETDGVVAGFLARIRQPEPINLASPAFGAALQYLVSKGCIAADRVAALSALPA